MKTKQIQDFKIITIFGIAGTGTSSCGKILAQKLDYDFLSTGNLIREMAHQRNMTLNKFEELMKKDKKIDLAFDKKIKELGLKDHKKGIVIDSRLAWFFIPHSFKIKFKCEDTIRIKRVAHRDELPFKEAKDKIMHREQIHKHKFKKLYGIKDYQDDKNFDLIIDTTNLRVEDIILSILK